MTRHAEARFHAARFHATLARILYDPLSWLPVDVLARAERSRGGGASPHRSTSASIASRNHALLDAYGLDVELDLARDDLASAWVEHWWALRRIALLIGCRCLRDAIVAARRWTALDPGARAFAILPMLAPPASSLMRAADIDETVLTAQGYVIMQSTFAHHRVFIAQTTHDPHASRIHVHAPSNSHAARQSSTDADPRHVPMPSSLSLPSLPSLPLPPPLPRALRQRLRLMFEHEHRLLDGIEVQPILAPFRTLIESAIRHAENPAYARAASAH
ncbi:hypothetical protein [Pararobbsia silviterrae]|nr:hypothetical protein [Pararobbsia silviterrae]